MFAVSPVAETELLVAFPSLHLIELNLLSDATSTEYDVAPLTLPQLSVAPFSVGDAFKPAGGPGAGGGGAPSVVNDGPEFQAPG